MSFRSVSGYLILTMGLLLGTGQRALAVDYDVYILAGQSNMDGRGSVKDLVGPLADYAPVQADVRLWYSNSTLRPPLAHSDGWVPLRPGFSVSPPGPEKSAASQPASSPASAKHGPLVPGPTFGPEVGFARTIAPFTRATGHKLAVIKFSLGGTNLHTQWNPATRGQLYDGMIETVRQALDALTARGDTADLRGLVWHQGESDANLPAERYEALLKSFIAAVRRDTAQPDLPVYLGECYDNGKRLSIRAAQLRTAATVPHVFVVGSGGLDVWDKGTHFTAASQIELGRRFAMAVMTRGNILPSPMPTTLPATLPSTQATTEPDGRPRQ